MTEAELYGIDVKELAREAPTHPDQQRFAYMLSQRFLSEFQFWRHHSQVENHKNMNDHHRKMCASYRDIYIRQTKALRQISQNVREDDRIVNYGRRENG